MNIGELRIAVKVANNTLKTTVEEIKNAFKKAGVSIEEALSGKGSKEFKKIAEEANKATKTIGGLNNKLFILKTQLENTEIGTKEFKKLQKEIKKTEKELKKASGEASGFIGILKKFGPTLATIFSIGAITSFTKSIFNLTSKIEQIKISFETLLGSVKKADKLFNKLTIFASKTPFNRLKLTEQTQKLLGFGFAGNQVLPIMKSLGDAVSAIGGNDQTLDGIILALGQIKAKGKLSAEELMQMAERGLPVFEILEKKLGLTKEQIGNIGNEAISANEAIPALLEGLNEKFTGAMEAQSATLAGKWSNMIDNIEAKMSELGAKLSPFFAWIIDKISSIIIPVLIVLGKIIDGFIKTFGIIKTNFIKFKEFFKKNLDKIQKYFDKFLQIFVSSFIGALIFIKKATIKEFIAGTIKFILNGLKQSKIAVINLTKVIIPNTLEIIKNTLAKTYNKIASIKLTKANILSALSFKQLGRSIFGTTKRLLFFAGRFFFIATIVAMVVVGIYKNWNKLKQKLQPIFEYIGQIGQKAPEIIADAWNLLVDVIAGVVKSILGTTEKLIHALNIIPGVNIDTQGLKNAIKAVDDFTNKVKFSGKDVKLVFKSIKDSTKGLLNDFGDTGLGGLNDRIFDIKENFSDLGDEAKSAGNKASSGAKQAKEEQEKLNNKLEDTKSLYDNYKKKLEELAKIKKENHRKTIDYLYEEKSAINEIKRSLGKLNEEYNKKIENIEKDKNKQLSERIIEIDSQIPELKTEYNQEKDPIKKKELQDKIRALQKERDEAYLLVDKKILKETQDYNNLTITGKIKYDADKAKQEAEKEFIQKKQRLEKELEIREKFLQLKKITQKDLDKALQSKDFLQKEKWEQDLIISLAKKKIELTTAKNEEIELQQEIANKTIELQNKVHNILSKNINDLTQKYKNLINEINKILLLHNQLSNNNIGLQKIKDLPTTNNIQNSTNSINNTKNIINNNIKIEIKGNVRETADIEKIAEKISEKIKNETQIGNKNFY